MILCIRATLNSSFWCRHALSQMRGNKWRRFVIWPAGWCTSRATSSSARTSTSSTWYPGSLCSPSSCTAIPGGPADPALWPRCVSCSSCHCLSTEKDRKQINTVNSRRRGYLDSGLKIGISGSRRTVSVNGPKKPQWLLSLVEVEPT